LRAFRAGDFIFNPVFSRGYSMSNSKMIRSCTDFKKITDVYDDALKALKRCGLEMPRKALDAKGLAKVLDAMTKTKHPAVFWLSGDVNNLVMSLACGSVDLVISKYDLGKVTDVQKRLEILDEMVKAKFFDQSDYDKMVKKSGVVDPKVVARLEQALKETDTKLEEALKAYAPWDPLPDWKDIRGNKNLVQQVYTACKKELALEQIEFLLAVDKNQAFDTILKTFILLGSPKELNLENKDRDKIAKDKDLSIAYSQVMMMLKQNTIDRIKKEKEAHVRQLQAERDKLVKAKQQLGIH